MSSDGGEEFEDVVVEFEGNFDLDRLADKQMQLIGIDTSEPVLRIDSKFYRIDVKDSIGTKLILQHEHSELPDGKRELKYLTKSEKTITASRVMIKPNKQQQQSQEEQESASTDQVFSKD